MSSLNILPLINNLSGGQLRPVTGNVMLVKPPYFTPWTPPLGIAILKSFLEQNGFVAKCFDFNIDPELWGMHHHYFTTLQKLEDVSTNDGYSKLWWVLNAHMLAYANDADPAKCARVLETVIPLYGIRCDLGTINALIPLVEGFFRRLGELTDQVDWSRFSVVGTSTYTTSLSSSLFILKRVKERYPHVKTVMGGGVFADDLALGSDNLNTLIEEYPYVDHAVLGEGELLFLKLLQGEFANKKVITLSDLKGSTLPMSDVPTPDFSDLNNEMYYHLSIEGARSCPFQCNFCSETIQWGEYRKKPIKLFTDQIVRLAEKHNNKTFFMGDSLMNPYINPFATELIDRKTDILYDGYLRADKPVTNRGFVKMWAQSGLFRVRLGIESAASRVLDAMDKMTTPKVISDVLKTLASEGLRTTTYWIVGFPGETEEDFQETCDFIREHHRYIYELEAHPYYYYPYGQVGSRLYECRSLYPDEVTDIIKFRVWDIIGANPSRYDRYERLRRISQLASDLGLPNIYTMAERYDAEERWQVLHPLATEVYEGTRLERKEVRLSDYPLESAFGNWKRGDAVRPGRASVYCYQAAIAQMLDERVLSASVDELIRSNDILQMRLHDGKFFPVPEGKGDHILMTVYDCRTDGAEIRALKEEIIESLSSEMRPERGASIRVVLINRADQSCDLMLLAHKSLLDAKSVALLFEDLYRIYVQLSNGKPVSLRPAKKSFTELMKGNARVPAESSAAEPSTESGVSSLACKLATISINAPLSARIKSRIGGHDDLSARDTIASALVRSLAKAGVKPAVDITVDCRSGDADLEHAAGDLTTVERLPADIFKGEELKTSLQKIRAALSQIVDAHKATPGHQESAGRVLLDMEYFIEKPWPDDPAWSVGEFIAEENDLSGSYLLKVVPVLDEGRIEVRLLSRDSAEADELADLVSRHLVEEAEAIVAHRERFGAAKQYWLKEFRKPVPEINIGISGQASDGPYYAQDFVKCEVEAATLRDLISQCNADSSAVLLAGFSVMISRLSGSQDLAFIASTDKDRKVKIAPVRVHPYWDLEFIDLVKEAERKLKSSAEHEEFALDVLVNHLPEPNEDSVPSAFNIGYLFCSEQRESDEFTMRDWLKQCPGAARELDIILKVVESSGGIDLYLRYPGFLAERGVMRKLASYLSDILREASRSPQVVISELGVIEYGAEYAADASETFDF